MDNIWGSIHCQYVRSKKLVQSRDYLQDLYRLLHFVDDWELDEGKEWDTIYDHPKEEVKEGTATDQTKHGLFEDAYMKRW